MVDRSLQKCIRDNCLYFKNPDILNHAGGEYCCKRCKHAGEHGPLCKRRLIPNTAIQGKFTLESISVYIFNWKKVSENSLKLYENINKVISDITIVNCDEKLKLNSAIKNIQLDDTHYYGSQYEHAIKDVKDNKILCVIVGDNIANNAFKDIFKNTVCLFNKYKVGVYGPHDKRSPHKKFYNMVEDKVFNIKNTDCGFWFINPEIVKIFKPYNFKNLSPYGWGIDVITINESRRLGYKVLSDFRVETDQIDHTTNYNAATAIKKQHNLIAKYNNQTTDLHRNCTPNG